MRLTSLIVWGVGLFVVSPPNHGTAEDVTTIWKSKVPGYRSGVGDLVFSPSGKSLAIVITEEANPTAVAIRDVKTGKGRFVLKDAHRCSFSRDGKHLAVLVGRDLVIVDPRSGEVLQRWQGGDAKRPFVTPVLGAIAFSPAADALFVGVSQRGGQGPHQVIVWHLAANGSWKPAKPINMPRFISDARFSPNGKWLASGGMITRVSGKRINTTDEKVVRGGWHDFAWATDSLRFGVTTAQGWLHWKPNGPRLLRKSSLANPSPEAHNRRIAIAHGLMATAGGNAGFNKNPGDRLRLWRVPEGTKDRPPKLRMELDFNDVTALAFSPDGTKLAVGASKLPAAEQLFMLNVQGAR